MQLNNQRALVIGGGTGIGRGVAHALAGVGCQVAVAGRRAEKLQETCDSYDGSGKILHYSVDVAERESVTQLVTWFNESLGNVDILVNAAGINIRDRTMAAMDPEEWDRVLRINATGGYNCLWAVLPQMRTQGQGTIVQISSVAGKRALDLAGVAYCASKFAMTALGTAVGSEVASDGVRVTNIYPGEVDTPILENRPNPVSDEHRATMLQPSDVAAMVVAVCSLPPRAHVPEVVIKPRVQSYC